MSGPLVSLGFRTDLMLLELQGSEVEAHDDYLVVRSPHNPDFWWGNFLLFRRRPEEDSVEELGEGICPRVPRCDAPGVWSGRHLRWHGEYEAFVGAGYDVEASVVMTATEVHASASPERRRDVSHARPDRP